MANPVTPELVTAYWFCQRKAFLFCEATKAALRTITHGYSLRGNSQF